MRNCGVTNDVVCRCSCRYTIYHTENSNNLEQNIGTIWHKRSMLVNDNTAEYEVSQEKRNQHKTIYDGTIGIKRTFLDGSTDMKSRVIDLFDATPSRANFLTVVTFSETVGA